jgi:hypothetical protein
MPASISCPDPTAVCAAVQAPEALGFQRLAFGQHFADLFWLGKIRLAQLPCYVSFIVLARLIFIAGLSRRVPAVRQVFEQAFFSSDWFPMPAQSSRRHSQD